MHPSLPAARDMLCELARFGPVDSFSWDSGRTRDGSGISVAVPFDQGLKLLKAVRAKLPEGLVAFLGTTRVIGAQEKRRFVEVVIGPGSGHAGILRLARCGGGKSGPGTEAVVAKVEAWSRLAPLDLFHAETESLELLFQSIPPDVEALARDVFAFCPDTVNRGCGSLEILTKQLGETGRILLWWDSACSAETQGNFREMR